MARKLFQFLIGSLEAVIVIFIVKNKFSFNSS